MKTVIEQDDLIAGIKSGDLDANDLVAALSVWIDQKEGQGYDGGEVRRHLTEFTEEMALGMPWVGNRPAAKCPPNHPQPGYHAPRDPYRS